MKYTNILTTALITVLLMGCATSAKNKADQQISQQPTAVTPAQAAADGRTAIMNSQNLTEEQRMKILSVIDTTTIKLEDIKMQQGQVLAALMNSLAKGEYVDAEMNQYKSKLQKLENKKMDIMFANFKQMKSIIGPKREADPRWFKINLVELQQEGVRN